MNIRTFTIPLILTIISFSCRQEARFPVPINLDCAVENNDPKLYAAFAPLPPDGVAFSENYIAAYDPETEVLSLFDKTGNFLNHIAHRGLGMEEFDAIFSMMIDEVHNIIYIFDWKKLHRYTLKGCYINTLHLGTGESDGFAITENGTIVVHHCGTIVKTSYTLYDTLGNILYKHPNPIQRPLGKVNPFFVPNFASYIFNKQLYITDISDTLFLVERDRLVPRFVFKGSHTLSTKENINAEDYSRAYKMATVAETSDYLVFETAKNEYEPAKQWSYHKQRRKLYYSLSQEKTVAPLPILKKESVTRYVSKNSIKNFIQHVNGVSFTMIAIPGGSFERKNFPDPDFSAQKQYINEVSIVHLDSYFMAETEVTQALWKAVMGQYHVSFDKNEQKPVNEIRWMQAIDFIQKLNMLTGKSFRLPTEAEWVYAAGGAKYPLTKWAGTDHLNELSKYAHFIKNGGSPAPVKSKLPNQMGLYDMSGNVFEWCIDWYDDYPDEKELVNPKGSIKGGAKVFKDGHGYLLINNAEPSHITERSYMFLDYANLLRGFRLSMSFE